MPSNRSKRTIGLGQSTEIYGRYRVPQGLNIRIESAGKVLGLNL